MRAVAKRSERQLTSRNLIVNWEGADYLIYRMTKLQMRKVFAGAKEVTIQGKFNGDELLNKEHLTFKIKRRSSGGFSIGCESFTKEEVKELRQWCKLKR